MKYFKIFRLPPKSFSAGSSTVDSLPFRNLLLHVGFQNFWKIKLKFGKKIYSFFSVFIFKNSPEISVLFPAFSPHYPLYSYRSNLGKLVCFRFPTQFRRNSKNRFDQQGMENCGFEPKRRRSSVLPVFGGILNNSDFPKKMQILSIEMWCCEILLPF